MNKHYLMRKPSISYAFALYDRSGSKVGVLTVGKPASHSLCVGLLGEDYSKKVYELNRFYTEDGLPKNTESYFLSGCLKLLKPYNLAIVSYADTGMGHHGYIYQATNWLYTGRTKERTDKYTPGGKHSRHYTDRNKHLRKVRTAKERYVYFACDRRTKSEYIKALNYEVKPYPKGNNERYEVGKFKAKTKVLNRKTGESWWE